METQVTVTSTRGVYAVCLFVCICRPCSLSGVAHLFQGQVFTNSSAVPRWLALLECVWQPRTSARVRNKRTRRWASPRRRLFLLSPRDGWGTCFGNG